MGSAPEGPSADSSTEIAGRRGIRPSDSMRVARSVMKRSVSRPCTTPVRNAPLMRGARKIRAARTGAERRDEQMLGVRSLPVLRGAGMFERNAAAGVILREAAPGGEIQLVGFLQLREIAFQARSFGQQAEDAPLIEHVDVVFPHHVIDGGKPLAVADQRGRQAREAIVHGPTPSRSRSEAPAIMRSCGHPPGNRNGDCESGAIHRMRKTFGRDVAGRAAQFVRRQQHGALGDHRGRLLRLAPARAAFDAAAPRDGGVVAALPIHRIVFSGRVERQQPVRLLGSREPAAASRAATRALPSGPNRATARRPSRNRPAAATRCEPAPSIALRQLRRRTERRSRARPAREIPGTPWSESPRRRCCRRSTPALDRNATRNGPRPWFARTRHSLSPSTVQRSSSIAFSASSDSITESGTKCAPL